MSVDLAWQDAVRAACEPMFLSCGAGFEWNESVHFDPQSPSLLWEADPERFAERFPDSEIEGSYASAWPPHCIDYWIYVDPRQMTATLSPEGWNMHDETLPITGDGARDGRLICAWFARVLGVPPSPGATAQSNG